MQQIGHITHLARFLHVRDLQYRAFQMLCQFLNNRMLILRYIDSLFPVEFVINVHPRLREY